MALPYSGSTILNPVPAGTVASTSATSEFDIAITGAPEGGTFTLEVTVAGGTGAASTAAIAFDADAAAIQAAIEALADVGADEAPTTGTNPDFHLAFVGTLDGTAVTVTLDDNSLTGGTTPSVDVDAGTPAEPTTYVVLGSDPEAFHPQATGLENASRVGVVATVSAATGTAPTLDVVLEGSADGGYWFPICTVAQLNDEESAVAWMPAVNIVPPHVRVSSLVGGDASSFTYSVFILAS